MIRTQIQLTEEQMRNLRRAARAQGVSVAEMVRRLVERGIADELKDRHTLYESASRLVGGFRDRSEAADVSERHDAYLDEAYR